MKTTEIIGSHMIGTSEVSGGAEGPSPMSSGGKARGSSPYIQHLYLPDRPFHRPGLPGGCQGESLVVSMSEDRPRSPRNIGFSGQVES